MTRRYYIILRWLAVVCCLFAAVLLARYVGRMLRTKRMSELENCQENLAKLDVALAYYAQDHSGSYPADLAMLLRSPPATESDPPLLRRFLCPGRGDRAPGIPTDVMNWMDYIYVGGLGASAPARMAVLICPGGTKHRRGIVLFSDHTIALRDGERLRKLISTPWAECDDPGHWTNQARVVLPAQFR